MHYLKPELLKILNTTVHNYLRTKILVSLNSIKKIVLVLDTIFTSENNYLYPVPSVLALFRCYLSH